MKRPYLYYTCLFLLTASLVQGQPILFSRLTTADGLSDNNARSICIDNNGFLWIGTSDGLNVYDGYTVTSFFPAQYPEMASNVVLHLMCDKQNRVWMGSYTGASWLDENRKFHRITIEDTLTRYYCPGIFETASYDVVVYADKGQYYFDSTANKWKVIDWIPARLNGPRFIDAETFSADQIIFTMDTIVAILDYKSKKVIYEQKFKLPLSACAMNDKEIAIGLQTGKVLIVNIETGKTVRDYTLTNELNGKEITTYLTEVRRAANGDLLVATDFAGLITIDKHGIINRHTHDPLKPGSISGNNTYRSFAGKNGEVVVGTYTSGANIGNVFNKPAGYTHIFKDSKGNLFDNYITDIAEESDNVFWIGTYDRLIRWDKKTNLSSFYYYYYQSAEGMRALEVRTVCLDKTGRVWAGVSADGLCYLDRSKGVFHKMPVDTSLGRAVASNYVYDLLTATDGTIWVGSTGGIYSINPSTLKVTSYINHPVLKEVNNKRVVSLFEDRKQQLWIGTTTEAFCYNKKDNTLKKYTKADGLISGTIYGFADDEAGNIYVATSDGFGVIGVDGKLDIYTTKNGLRYTRCEGVLADIADNIWISNGKCILKFIPGAKRFEVYEENAGLSIAGFRVSAFLQSATGELLWGSQSGINYFYPGQLSSSPSPIHLSLYGIHTEDTLLHFSSNRHLSLPYSRDDISFYFTAARLSGSRGITYQYKLDGYESDWHTGTDIREAHYSSLPAGNYTFLVKASADRINWITSQNKITLNIIPPVWQRWWFVSAAVILLTGGIFWYVQNRNSKIRRQDERLETEQAINYFASSMHDQQKIDDILWDVARNCIGRLKFEDCVIYMVDEERNVLVQKAAHGPKSPRSYEIESPMEIPVGKGIVGSVAQSGKAEVIRDTTKEPRYIVDDERRYSEITVPIISDGKVIGIIDCEHSQKNFFGPKHLSILTTIASLCANKITRAQAEAEKEETLLALIETQQKMSEVEMQALRAQMNPHFIFNCLNSINRYIVKSDQATASLYLTKFAKLIRLILDNSNSKNVILSNELEALKLYIDMEALRFDKKFSYKIIVDPSVAADSIEVPPLIIQPYVENAIWHGLLHMPTVGHLNIHISLPGSNMLQCVIEDNGIGREKAKELRSKSVTTKKSLGMKLTENRLSLLNKHAELNASVEIIDLVNDNEAAGTKVILKIPI